MLSKLTLPATLALLLSACANVPPEPIAISKGTVIDNVTIVNTRDGSLQTGMAVVVDGGKIVKIAAADHIRTVGTSVTVDATGKFLVPGFLDMHAHAMESADRPVTYWPLMLANGITGFREMSGSPELLARGKLLRQQIAEGKVLAPELLMQPGRLLNQAPDGRRAVIDNSAAAKEEVAQQKQMGADFIKLLNVSRDVFFATVQEAQSQGLSVAGHLTPVVSATEASNAGMRVMEHLGAGIINLAVDCTQDEARIRQTMAERFAAPRAAPPGPIPLAVLLRILANPILAGPIDASLLQNVLDSFDEKKCRALARTFVKNGTWQVPTLIRIRTMQMGNDPVFRNDPNLKYVAPPVRAMWQDVADEYTRRIPAAVDKIHRDFYALQLRLVKLFQEEGVKMLAGADMTGQWDIPGFSLHQEFHELALAGLTPLQILQMTTLNAAEFLDRSATMGTVEEGKNSDLVVLDANPLENVQNFERIRGVMVKGRYLPRDTLDKMKGDVAAAYRN